MSDFVFTSGDHHIPIENRAYEIVQTTQAKNICIGLEVSNIPYSANFTDKELKLTYDKNYSDSVDEILKRAKSGDYDEMLREIRENMDGDGYLILLPTVAYYLNMTEGALKLRPEEQQMILCKLFVDLWFADTLTIKRELGKAICVNRETERDLEQPKPEIQPDHNAQITRDMLERQAEIIKRQQAVKEKMIAERSERERKF